MTYRSTAPRRSLFASKTNNRPVESLERRVLFSAGDLDPHFGSGGALGLPSFDTGFSGSAVDVNAGRIALGGTTGRGAAVIVTDLDGDLLTSFGGDGSVEHAFSFPGPVHDIAVQDDGKIVVVAGEVNGAGVVGRFNADGSIDTSFGGGDGEAPLSGSAHAVVIAPDGKIVVAGDTTARRYVASRFNADGSLDAYTTTTQLAPHSSGIAKDVAVLPDGRIVIAGKAAQVGEPGEDGIVIAFRADLTGVDHSFGTNGVTRIEPGFDMFSGSARALAVDAQGRLIVASALAEGVPFVTRISPAGVVEKTTRLDLNSDGAGFDDVSVAPDGKIVLSGATFYSGDFLLRLNPDFTPDAEFGGGDGVVYSGEEGRYLGSGGVYSDVQPDGKIVTGGVLLARHVADSGFVGSMELGADRVVRVLGTGGRDRAHVVTAFDGDPTLIRTFLNGRSKDFRVADGGGVIGVEVRSFDGDDVVIAEEGAASFPQNISVTIDGDGGRDVIQGVSGRQVILGGADNDVIRLGGGNDFAFGEAGNDVIYGQDGNDTLDGGDGDDILDGGLGADDMTGGDGFDTADYSYRTEALTVGIGNFADDGAPGEKDNVRIGIEQVNGGSGNDSISGDAAGNVLRGNGGNDTLRGNGGDDQIAGDAGDDTLVGGDDNDALDGGLGADEMSGNAGTDAAVYEGRTENLTIGIGSFADDGAPGERDNVRTGIEVVSGGEGNDAITGDSANNVLRGNGGNDMLRGGGGNDILGGQAGVDRLYGDAGNDQLFSRDGVAEPLDGGSGTDSVQKDDDDTVVGIESLLA